MVRSLLVGFFRGLNRLLHSPLKVVWLCLALVVLNLGLDGSWLHLWTLHSDFQNIQSGIHSLEQQNSKLRMQLARAKDPAFLEREARDRFDLVSEGDLVFVFSEEEEAP